MLVNEIERERRKTSVLSENAQKQSQIELRNALKIDVGKIKPMLEKKKADL